MSKDLRTDLTHDADSQWFHRRIRTDWSENSVAIYFGTLHVVTLTIPMLKRLWAEYEKRQE